MASFVARSIQMKAASEEHFFVFRKYEKFPDLILAFVWNLSRSDQTRTYALTYADALEIADAMGWTSTPSWTKKKGYNTQRPSKRMKEILSKHEMTPRRWWD